MALNDQAAPPVLIRRPMKRTFNLPLECVQGFLLATVPFFLVVWLGSLPI